VKYCFAINLRFISQGELKRIVKLKLSSNFKTKWSRLRISRGNSYELNNSIIIIKDIIYISDEEKDVLIKNYRAVIEKLDSMIKSMELARK